MALLEEILAAHGGLAAFQQFNEVRATITIGGKLISAKGLSGRPRALQLQLKTREIKATISQYPTEGYRGVYTPQRAWIEDQHGVLQRERQDPRANFARGLLHVPWDDLDLLYFFGYALWNYLLTPFLFVWPGVEVKEGIDHTEGGERWKALRVTFPEEVPSHCKTQTFFFDRAGLLRRLDYTAEIVGSIARGAHYCYDHKNFDGFMIPTRREVFPMLGQRPIKLTNVMAGHIEQVSFLR